MRHLINYGTMGGIGGNRGDVGATTPMSVTNYGVMGAIDTAWGSADITINNLGFIGMASNNGKTRHLAGGSYSFIIQNYTLMMTQNATTFNAFSGSAVDNSQVVLDGGSMRFFDDNAKVFLNFGGDFSFGEAYLLDKLFVDMNGKSVLNVDFSRLTVPSDIYYLTQSGNSFIVHLAPQYGAMGSLYKSNIRTMNNFMILSNSMIYPRKYSKSQNLRKSSLRADSQNLRGNPKDLQAKRSNHPPYENIVDSALSLKSYESFSYRNESQNRRIKRQNKRNYSRNVKDSSLRADSQNLRGNPKDLRAKRSNHLAQNPHDYYFILTPFINHNLFFESGRYNLSGFDYGFLTAFSARVAESNSLGAHFIMSYGSLGDSSDKNFHISNLNLNLGLNYKLDLIWDMYLKARGDFFYFLNQVKTLTMINAIKPNNLGFGASVSYGKDFDFKQGGILGIEGGIDYKALQSNKVSIDSQEYQKAIYNLIYADLGVNYTKYFGGFGINLGGGFKANLAPNLAKSILLINSQNLSLMLDNDKILGYANLGLSYVLNHKNFDMEFSLAYYGNYGDRIISNGGGFEWRTTW